MVRTNHRAADCRMVRLALYVPDLWTVRSVNGSNHWWTVRSLNGTEHWRVGDKLGLDSPISPNSLHGPNSLHESHREKLDRAWDMYHMLGCGICWQIYSSCGYFGSGLLYRDEQVQVNCILSSFIPLTLTWIVWIVWIAWIPSLSRTAQAAWIIEILSPPPLTLIEYTYFLVK